MHIFIVKTEVFERFLEGFIPTAFMNAYTSFISPPTSVFRLHFQRNVQTSLRTFAQFIFKTNYRVFANFWTVRKKALTCWWDFRGDWGCRGCWQNRNFFGCKDFDLLLTLKWYLAKFQECFLPIRVIFSIVFKNCL